MMSRGLELGTAFKSNAMLLNCLRKINKPSYVSFLTVAI